MSLRLAMNLSTYVAQCDRYTLVMLHGEIDVFSPRLAAELPALIDARVVPVIVDMCAVNFCDFWGLNIVVKAKRHASERGVRLGLVGLIPHVRSSTSPASTASSRCITIYRTPCTNSPRHDPVPPSLIGRLSGSDLPVKGK